MFTIYPYASGRCLKKGEGILNAIVEKKLSSCAKLLMVRSDMRSCPNYSSGWGPSILTRASEKMYSLFTLLPMTWAIALG